MKTEGSSAAVVAPRLVEGHPDVVPALEHLIARIAQPAPEGAKTRVRRAMLEFERTEILRLILGIQHGNRTTRANAITELNHYSSSLRGVAKLAVPTVYRCLTAAVRANEGTIIVQCFEFLVKTDAEHRDELTHSLLSVLEKYIAFEAYHLVRRKLWKCVEVFEADSVLKRNRTRVQALRNRESDATALKTVDGLLTAIDQQDEVAPATQ